MATMNEKMSFTVLHETNPLVASLLEAAQTITTVQWGIWMKDHPAKVISFLSALEELRAVAVPDRATPVFPRSQVEKLATLMGKVNKEIATGDTSFQPFLAKLGFPTQRVPCPGGIFKQLSFLPRKPHPRSVHVDADARARVEAELFEAPTGALRVFKLSNMLTPTGAAALPAELFHEGATPNCVVQWHSSRRAAHCTSAEYCAGTLKLSMQSEKTKLRVLAGPKEEIVLSVPCQLCCEAKVAEPHMVDLPQFGCIDLFRKIAPATPRILWETSVAAASHRDRTFRRFTCPTEGCKHNEVPFVFQEAASCVPCVRARNEHGVTNFHSFACPGCDTNPAGVEACGLCCQPKSKHTGETLICPMEDRPTAAQRALARSEGNNYCPCCDTVVSRITSTGEEDGCPKLTCPRCLEVFCGDCDAVQKKDPHDGSYYVHVCPTPRVGTKWGHVWHAPPAGPADPMMLAAMAVHVPGKVNPARHHRIGERFGVMASTPVSARPSAPMAAMGGGGDAAAPMAAMGGGGGAAAAAAPMVAMGGGGAAAAAAPMVAMGDGGAAAAAPMAAMGGGGGAAAAPMAAMGGAAGGGGGQVDIAWVLEVNPGAFVDAGGHLWIAGVDVGIPGVDL
jgi:hypothetical protein